METPLLQTLTEQSSSNAVTFADAVAPDEPLIPFAILGTGGTQDAVFLHVHHQGMNGAFVPAGVQTHATNDFGAGLGTVLNQGAADGRTDDGLNHGSEVGGGGRFPFPRCMYPTRPGEPRCHRCYSCSQWGWVHLTRRTSDPAGRR